MSSLTDILTTAQNIVTAITGLGQTYLSVQGKTNVADITAVNLVKNSAGRVCQVTVTVAGSAPGSIYDTTNTGAPSRKLYTIPNTIGSYTVNMPAQYGIVALPGTGQTITISYS